MRLAHLFCFVFCTILCWGFCYLIGGGSLLTQAVKREGLIKFLITVLLFTVNIVRCDIMVVPDAR